ncbi:MAG: patatin-like phospholipase family protein [Nitriliruptorales bacterium]|nr:patatin-like phospholipase family protein [Nitriliruptorales bacterium]
MAHGASGTEGSRYTPAADRSRAGTALCLSGGGYRAALFHLGALTRLNEVGALGQVDTIASVSGGSILAAHLATAIEDWPAPGESVRDWESQVAVPFRTFTALDVRTWPVLNRLMPWNWLRSDTAVRTLAAQYERYLTSIRLGDLPKRPRFVLCATDMTFGVNWIFDSGDDHGRRGRMGDYQAGYRPLADWPLARAVAASSCFPPVFNPLRPDLDADRLHDGAYDEDDRADLIGQLELSDGGVYDNMGLEPVWKDHQTVLVSDGGAVFEAERDTGLFWRLNRYTAVAGRQGSALRKRWLISNFVAGLMDGTYWGLGSVAAHYGGAGGYSDDLVDDVISEIRTDLDQFSEAETAALENHGYLLAEAALSRHAPKLISTDAPPTPPHPDWMDEERLRAALAESHQRQIFGRGPMARP